MYVFELIQGHAYAWAAAGTDFNAGNALCSTDGAVCMHQALTCQDRLACITTARVRLSLPNAWPQQPLRCAYATIKPGPLACTVSATIEQGLLCCERLRTLESSGAGLERARLGRRAQAHSADQGPGAIGFVYSLADVV
jgi:hypothetical protein